MAVIAMLLAILFPIFSITSLWTLCASSHAGTGVRRFVAIMGVWLVAAGVLYAVAAARMPGTPPSAVVSHLADLTAHLSPHLAAVALLVTMMVWAAPIFACGWGLLAIGFGWLATSVIWAQFHQVPVAVTIITWLAIAWVIGLFRIIVGMHGAGGAQLPGHSRATYDEGDGRRERQSHPPIFQGRDHSGGGPHFP